MKIFVGFLSATIITSAASAFAQTCAVNPLGTCLTAERSALTVRNDLIDTKDRLLWRWQKGEPIASTTLFDSPMTTTSYKLCTYSGTTLRVGGQVVIGPSPVLWQAKTTGYKYKDSAATSSGITNVGLKGDPEPSRSNALVKGKGLTLPDQTLPLVGADFPIVVQLVNNDTDFCLQSTFMEIDIKRNDSSQLKLKSQ